MTLQERIQAFINLGNYIAKRDDKLQQAIAQSEIYNPWFTKENIDFALDAWVDLLTEKKLQKWLSDYDFTKVFPPKTIGIVTAGNIPLVGMHDFVSVLISGHKILVKQSSNDKFLLPVLADFLIKNNQEFKDKITFTEDKLQNFNAVIATGSNNTARYFESYFEKYPHIIRKNRNAVAVLTGVESEVELEALGEDVFRYFGLGCRSVSKVFLPKGYDLNKIFASLFKHKDIVQHNKYKNNYDYNRAIYVMGGVPVLENGFALMKEDSGYASPIAVLYYEFYENLSLLKTRLQSDAEEIQCAVSQESSIENAVPFGKSQQPELWDYADGVDTMKFLLSL
jgi:hypothetical protein